MSGHRCLGVVVLVAIAGLWACNVDKNGLSPADGSLVQDAAVPSGDGSVMMRVNPDAPINGSGGMTGATGGAVGVAGSGGGLQPAGGRGGASGGANGGSGGRGGAAATGGRSGTGGQVVPGTGGSGATGGRGGAPVVGTGGAGGGGQAMGGATAMGGRGGAGGLASGGSGAAGAGGSGGAAPTCSAATCRDGCCDDGVCVTQRTAAKCGTGGALCQACGGCQTCGSTGTCAIDPASRWTIVCAAAELTDDPPSGNNWDRANGEVGGRPPDPFCQFETTEGNVSNGAELTSTVTDSFSAMWNQTVTPAGATISGATLLSQSARWLLWVGDDDGCDEEGQCIGTVACEIAPPMQSAWLADGGFTLSNRDHCASVTVKLLCQSP